MPLFLSSKAINHPGTHADWVTKKEKTLTQIKKKRKWGVVGKENKGQQNRVKQRQNENRKGTNEKIQLKGKDWIKTYCWNM